jgi:hypothetical protein
MPYLRACCGSQRLICPPGAAPTLQAAVLLKRDPSISPADLGAWESACDKSGTVPPGAAPLSSGCGRILTCSDKMARWNAVGVQGTLCMRAMRTSWKRNMLVVRCACFGSGWATSIFRAIRAYAATPLEPAAGLRQLDKSRPAVNRFPVQHIACSGLVRAAGSHLARPPSPRKRATSVLH